MRKLFLVLSLVALLTACSGGAEETPAATGVGRSDPTLPPSAPTPEASAPGVAEAPAKSTVDPVGEMDPAVTFLPPSADPAEVTDHPSDAPSETPSSTPSETPSGTPSGTPSDAPAAAISAGTVAGEDYDFSQPVPETVAVGEDYFADAVMIGDSRTEGFKLFSGLTQGEYMAHTGLMIFKISDTKITFNGEKMTVPEALGTGSFGKVYISLGVNELGMYDDQGYHDHFADFIDIVREKQPEATIYLQLLIPVNTRKCADKGQADYVTNKQIGIYNDILRQVAQEKRVFLVDPAQAVVDETGEPPYDATADGVHLQPAGYQLWYEYLTKHTVDKGEWT